MSKIKLELLSPAKNLETGIAAINCGADAVYIGAPQYGARSAAGNPLSDIRQLVEYAHKYWVKVYVTVNTIIYDDELEDVRLLINHLYEIGVDAVIFQDMALLEMEIPPIPLFASTQTHNYEIERIKFLDQLGIQRIILARELTLDEVKQIKKEVNAELEFFVHGALCVSLSGQCYMSHELTGRSANRGECAQNCRLPYSLVDAKGNAVPFVEVNRHPAEWMECCKGFHFERIEAVVDTLTLPSFGVTSLFAQPGKKAKKPERKVKTSARSMENEYLKVSVRIGLGRID